MSRRTVTAAAAGRAILGYASGRMLLTDAPNLPLVIGLPMLLLFGSMAAAAGTWFVMSRLRRQ